MRLVPPPVKEAALRLGCPVFQPESLRAEAREALVSLSPDVLVVVAYGRLLGPRLLAAVPHGAVNLHFSLLPRWRGAAPVQRAMIAGDEVSGVSIIRLVQELDAGPVLARRPEPIEPGEHAPALQARLAREGAELLLETLDAMDAGLTTEEPQDESLVTLAPPLTRDEGWLDAMRPARHLALAVRALDPWPGTRLGLPRGVIAVLEAEAVTPRGEWAEGVPGELLRPRGDALPLVTADGVLLLKRVRPEGKSAMSGASLVHGRFATPGDRAARPGGASGASGPTQR